MAVRAHKIELQQVTDPESGETYSYLPRDDVDELVSDIVTTMLRMGGMATLGVRRVQTGDVSGQPTYATVEFIALYNTAAPSEERTQQEPAPAPTVIEPPDVSASAAEQE